MRCCREGGKALSRRGLYVSVYRIQRFVKYGVVSGQLRAFDLRGLFDVTRQAIERAAFDLATLELDDRAGTEKGSDGLHDLADVGAHLFGQFFDAARRHMQPVEDLMPNAG